MIITQPPFTTPRPRWHFLPSFQTLARFGVSMGLIVALFYYVIDPQALLDTFQKLDPTYAALAYLVFQLDRMVMAYKWNLLLRARSYYLPHSRAVEIYSSAMFLGTFLPSTLGADVIRAILARRAGVGTTDVVGTIAVERAVGFLCAVALALAGLVTLRFTTAWDDRYAMVILVGIAGLASVIVGLALSFHPRSAAIVARMIPDRIRASTVGRKTGRLVACYQALGASRSVLVRFLGLTCLEQMIPVIFIWVIACAFGLQVSPLVILGSVPLSVLLARLPISVSGIGVFDGAFAALLASSGVAPQYAVAIAFTGRAIEILGCLPWYLRSQLRGGRANHVADAAARLREAPANGARAS